MTDLRGALDDLVTHVPAHVGGGDAATRSWARGRRRRLRHRLGGTAIVSAVAVVLAMAVAPLVGGPGLPLPIADDTDPGVDGYPQRIGHQWWVRALPDRPGPVAALINLSRDDGTDPGTWFAVSDSGHRWRIPMQEPSTAEPSISADGRRIAYLAGNGGPYVIHDLTTGERILFPRIGGEGGERTTRYSVHYQYPGYWSPDGTSVLVGGRGPGDDELGTLRLDLDGTVTLLDDATATGRGGAVHYAGWTAENHVVWYSSLPGEEGSDPVAEVEVHISTADGERVRSVVLRPDTPWRTDFLSQWDGVAGPLGSEIAILERASGDLLVRRFSITNGAELTGPVRTDETGTCAAGWARGVPIVPIVGRAEAMSQTTTAIVASGEVTVPVAVKPGLGSRCIIWAADALAGEAHGLFGRSMSWWTWWWRELAAGAALLFGLPIIVRVLRRRTSGDLRSAPRRGPAR
jgi:hypothetical protein